MARIISLLKIFVIMAMVQPTMTLSAKEEKELSNEHAEGVVGVLEHLVENYPPNKHVIVFFGTPTAIHAMGARILLSKGANKYFFYHPVTDFSTSAHQEDYVRYLVDLANTSKQKVVLVQQLGDRSDLKTVARIAADLSIKDMKNKLLIIGISSTKSLPRESNISKKGTNPDYIEIEQEELLNYTDSLPDFKNPLHPAQSQIERPSTLGEWMGRNKKFTRADNNMRANYFSKTARTVLSRMQDARQLQQDFLDVCEEEMSVHKVQ